MSYFLGQLINGLRMGSIYALVAIGYSIVYGILRLINFAHGDLMMVATYAVWFLLAIHMPFLPAAIIGILLTVVIAVLMEHAAYRPLRNSGSETTLMTSLAVSTLLQNAVMMLVSPQNQALKVPDFFQQQCYIGSIPVTYMSVCMFAVSILFLIIVSLVTKFTRIGMALRSCADDMEATCLMGININHVITFAFIISGVLAAAAGIMYSGEYISFSPSMGFMVGVKAFVAAVIGGIGSIGGAALGGLVLGLLEIFFAGFLPASFTAYRTAFVFLVLIIVLLIKPNGLFGVSEEKRS